MRTYQTDQHGQMASVTWRQWLLPLGAAAGIVALVPCQGVSPGMTLSYSGSWPTSAPTRSAP